MKNRIVCYGDSNTWGYNALTGGRFSEEYRWPRVLQRELGADYEVIEEGLCGRTTVFEDPLNEGLSGLNYLYPCLMSHSPIQGLVLMLGTNDTKERFNATPKNIADGMRRLVLKARQAPVWSAEPRILIIAPAPIEPECEQSPVSGEMGKCWEKSSMLAAEFKLCAEETGCSFLDGAETGVMNKVDYMHLTRESHEALGIAVKKVIKHW